MKKYHLITRPEEDALKLQAILKQKNKRSLLNPLLKIKFLLEDLKEFFKNNKHENICFIVTSVNSIRAIKKTLPQDLRFVTILVSSTICFMEAQLLGFKSVIQCGKCAADLESFFKINFDKNIRYIYISGDDVTIDISKILEEQGLVCKKIVVYKAEIAFLQKDTIHSFQHYMVNSY
jgi:uroporphyrinogen-III synthase